MKWERSSRCWRYKKISSWKCRHYSVAAPMDNLQIVVLAIVQGLTEFLPISSSAHLVLLPKMLGWTDQGLVFDVAVHFGSLLAVLYYFRHEVWRMLRAWLRNVGGGEADQDSLLAWWVIIATLPAIVFGFLLQGVIEESLRSPWVIATASIAFGLLLWLADLKGVRKRDIVPRPDAQGGGALFVSAGDAGDLRQRRVADGAHVHRGQPDRLGRAVAGDTVVGAQCRALYSLFSTPGGTHRHVAVCHLPGSARTGDTAGAVLRSFVYATV